MTKELLHAPEGHCGLATLDGVGPLGAYRCTRAFAPWRGYGQCEEATARGALRARTITPRRVLTVDNGDQKAH